MDWIEGQLDDESIFPQKLGNHCLSQIFDVGMVVCTLEIVQALLIYLSNFDTTHDTDMGLIPLPGTPFPPNFKEVVKTIFKRLFRVYAHIYHSHFQKIVSLKEEAHLNTCFKHFILFTTVSLLCLQIVNSLPGLFTYHLIFALGSQKSGENKIHLFPAFWYVVQEFGLIDKKELAPLQELIESIIPY